MAVTDEDIHDRIAATFANRNILITGGTGFLGKVLVEKFLRCLPEISQLYLLVRPKKGKDPKNRLEEIFNSALFEPVKAMKGIEALRSKVTIVSGDVSQLNLGLSQQDRKMLCERISIVYHGAATVRFDALLKRAVILNTRGTKQMLDLAKDIKKLDLFAHISTAYCHLEEKVLGEKPYPPPADPHKIIKCVEWMEDEVVEAMTDKILGDLPNTYAFTKALSEGLVEEVMSEIPVVILRPSIVIPIWKEPVPGWTDNINGPTGLLIGAGKGVIRTMYCNENGYADYVPVDIGVNAILAVTWNFIFNKDTEKRVYNLTSSSEFKYFATVVYCDQCCSKTLQHCKARKSRSLYSLDMDTLALEKSRKMDQVQVSWAEIIDIGRRITEKVPLNGVVWYPGGSMKKSRFIHNLCVFFFHMIPAYLIDALIFLAGHKPIMCRVHRRIQKGFEVFEYYANNQWDFENSNIAEIRSKLNDREKMLYQLHGDDMDLDEYFENCIRAARIFILNEPPETLPAARRHMRVMWWVDIWTKIIFCMFLIYILVCWSSGFWSLVFGSRELFNHL